MTNARKPYSTVTCGVLYVCLAHSVVVKILRKAVSNLRILAEK